MPARILLLAAGLFWLTMNVLLWRAEYGPHTASGGSVPPELIWRKMLTAPDSSSLSIIHHGQKIGFCHWTTTIGEELSRLKLDEVPPEGMVQKVGGYRIQLEGNVAWEDFTNRLRFDCALKLTTNQVWQEFSLRMNLRPTVWQVHSFAAEQTVRLRVEDGDDSFDRVFRFSDLAHPEELMADSGPFGPALMSGIGLPLNSSHSLFAQAIKWEARNDVLKLGHAQVRAYRMEAHWLDRFRAVIYISRVGEILRMELPDELVLENDQLANF